MKKVFVDSLYFIAVINPRDQWHKSALDFDSNERLVRRFTTEEVLIEVLNFFCESGINVRRTISGLVRNILLDPQFIVVSRNETDFLSALHLYESRLDKGYSLTDCISMNVCRKMNISDILTHDNHFTQEGFNILL
jgi:uncharacterized protein